MKGIVPLLAMALLSACSQQDPMQNARSNLISHINIPGYNTAGEYAILKCDGPVELPDSPNAYVVCSGMLEGFAHETFWYCNIKSRNEGGSCSSAKPK